MISTHELAIIEQPRGPEDSTVESIVQRFRTDAPAPFDGLLAGLRPTDESLRMVDGEIDAADLTSDERFALRIVFNNRWLDLRQTRTKEV